MVQYKSRHPYGTDTYNRAPSFGRSQGGTQAEQDELEKRRLEEERYREAQNRYIAVLNKNREDITQKSLVKQKGGIESALAAQQQAATARRDQQQQLYGQQNTNQRAGIAADASAQQFGQQTQRDQQQQKDLLRRDASQFGYSTQRDRAQQQDQLQRDQQQFGYQTQRDEKQFGYQTQRDQQQQQDLLQRDASQFGYSTQRDQQQFGYQTQRDQQQQQDLLQRDASQFGYSTQRDQQQFGYQTQRDEIQQGYTQQNATQRETFGVSERWNEQIQQARNAGMDFSESQQKEMKTLDESFQKNVMNGPFDEGLKQQAMLEHQRKLSAIIPNERVQSSQDGFDGSLVTHKKTGAEFIVSLDSRGFRTYEPLSSGQGKAAPTTQELASKQRKGALDREIAMQKLRDKLGAKTDPETGEPVYKNTDDLDKAAMDEFAPHEHYFREEEGLPPQKLYQQEIDREKLKQQQQQPQQQPFQPQGPIDPRGNEQWQIAPQQMPAGQASAKPPVLSARSPLPAEVGKTLSGLPGGKQLQALREKHSSTSTMDQTVRMAADIVINSVMTKDTSDPDLAEAEEILKKAGYKIGN